jgi:hypothetical protein
MVGGMRVGKSDDSSSITSGDSAYGTATASTFSGSYAELSQYGQVRHYEHDSRCYCLRIVFMHHKLNKNDIV